ncbi:hypothetical protein KQ41_06350 [Lysinibacillus fusiformis]|nr:hypothetical protein [Lysinibacillus fusiformis]KGA83664.1 hypothetical protein KQ41_06350 [Lysinibacillus fusiformis]
MRHHLLITIIFLKVSTLAILIYLESIMATEITAMFTAKNILSSFNYLLDMGLIVTNLPQKDVEENKN